MSFYFQGIKAQAFFLIFPALNFLCYGLHIESIELICPSHFIMHVPVFIFLMQ